MPLKKKSALKKSRKESGAKISPIKKLKAEIEHLKEMSHSKDEFIRITNHELRTPLDVIRGNIDMILKGEAGPVQDKTKEYLKDVLLGADRLTKLVNAMLDFSQAESGRMKFSVEDIDTSAFLKNIYEEFLPVTKEKGITLYLKIDPNIARVFSDKSKLYQIVDNLIGNAMKFTPKGGSITICGEKYGDMVRITIEDSGIGIRPDDMQKLFKRFPEIDTSVIGAPKGNGLGLALIHKITARLLGHMWAESAGMGKGSKFLFELPIVGTKAAKKLVALYPRVRGKK